MRSCLCKVHEEYIRCAQPVRQDNLATISYRSYERANQALCRRVCTKESDHCASDIRGSWACSGTAAFPPPPFPPNRSLPTISEILAYSCPEVIVEN